MPDRNLLCIYCIRCERSFWTRLAYELHRWTCHGEG